MTEIMCGRICACGYVDINIWVWCSWTEKEQYTADFLLKIPVSLQACGLDLRSSFIYDTLQSTSYHILFVCRIKDRTDKTLFVCVYVCVCAYVGVIYKPDSTAGESRCVI